jgi:hypothetical protein
VIALKNGGTGFMKEVPVKSTKPGFEKIYGEGSKEVHITKEVK